MYDDGERLTRLETKMELLEPIIRQTADDVRAVRDFMLTAKASAKGSWKVLSLIGALVGGAATIGAALAGFFHV